LQRLLKLFPEERGTQHRMTINGLLPCLLEGFDIQLPFQHAVELLKVDAGRGCIQAMKEHPLLHRRERKHILYVCVAH
jgi:hypothetical protein